MTTELDPLKDGMPDHESQVERIVAAKMGDADTRKILDTMLGVQAALDRVADRDAQTIVDMLVPILKSHHTAISEAMEQKLASLFDGKGMGGVRLAPFAGATSATALPTKEELAAKAHSVLSAWQRARSIAFHRDDEAALIEAIAEAFYVAPPVDPENVEGVG